MNIITAQNACKKNIYRDRDIRDRKCGVCGYWIARKSKSGLCQECYHISIRGQGNCNFKGESASQVAKHARIITIHGKAFKCENEVCHHFKTLNYYWVEISHNEFRQLCKRCLSEYYKITTIKKKLFGVKFK